MSGHKEGYASLLLASAFDLYLTQQALRRERRASPTSDHSTEDGEISHHDHWRKSPSREKSPVRKTSPKQAEKREADLDAVPANRQELNSARLSRYELVDIMFKDGWEAVATGK